MALEAVGQVKRFPRLASLSLSFSLDDIEDIYHWRQVLEDEAHRMAVPSSESGSCADASAQRRDSCRRARSRTPAFVELNRAFHFVPFERAGSAYLMRFISSMWDAAERYQNTMAFIKVPRNLLQEQHDSLMEAFEARDIGAVNGVIADTD